MAEGAANYLLAEEYLSAADERFVELLLTLHDPKRLASLADKWKRDHRPKVKSWIADYIDLGLQTYGHQPVIKRLFKNAEEKRDDDLMGVFLVSFDCLVRRVIRLKYRYDRASRSTYREQYLYTPRNTIRVFEFTPKFGPLKGKTQVTVTPRKGGRLFSSHTRSYLRRRVWRYFRRMGFKSPDKYPAAVAKTLARYKDGFLGSGPSLLDSWGLMHACFGESDLIEFTASTARVKPGQNLSALTAAPVFPALWEQRSSANLLLELLSNAGARPVRVWAMQLIQRHHLANLTDVSIERLMSLLENSDPEVQTLGAQLLENSRLLPTLSLESWLQLLQTKSLTALEIITRLMRQHIAPDRLSFSQLLELALVAPAPVARLGLDLLKQKPSSEIDVDSLTRLADTKSAAVAYDAAKWALSVVGATSNYTAERASRFFDSLQQPARRAAWEWLVQSEPPSAGYNDSVLWVRLLETPFDDLKLNLVRELQRRASLPGSDRNSLASLWASVLLGIHRGGRVKLAALRQISEALLRQPDDAETLLPVLAVAIRSVRLPEARGGLSAIVRAVDQHPDIAPLVAKYLPELQIPALEVTA
jgi:hypothetical protein